MSRLKALLNWLFNSRNNVTVNDLLYFLFRNSAKKRAFKYIKNINRSDTFIEISFNNIPNILYCPLEMSMHTICQVVCETFDTRDWHYYQKPFTQLKEGEKLLDVGAAEGLFALAVMDKCDKIFLVEPNLAFSSSLKKTFSTSRVSVEVLNVAAGNDEKNISFLQESINSRIMEDKGDSRDVIRLTKIDNLLKDQEITFLKADVEGHEVEMLKGAETTIKKNRPKIAITSYHKENFADEIISLVKSFVPEYKHYLIGIGPDKGKPVMIHFWID